MTDNTVTLPALIQVGPVTAKVCSWSSQEGQPDHRPRSHTSFTWLSTPCPQRLQSPSNRPTGPLLTFRPSGGSAGIAVTPGQPWKPGRSHSTECAFGKELQAVEGKQSRMRVAGVNNRLC